MKMVITFRDTVYNKSPLFTCDYKNIVGDFDFKFIVAVLPYNAEVDLYKWRIRLHNESGVFKKSEVLFLEDANKDENFSWYIIYTNLQEILNKYDLGGVESRKIVCIYSRDESVMKAGDTLYYSTPIDERFENLGTWEQANEDRIMRLADMYAKSQWSTTIAPAVNRIYNLSCGDITAGSWIVRPLEDGTYITLRKRECRASNWTCSI